jgi:hypothetical protein
MAMIWSVDAPAAISADAALMSKLCIDQRVVSWPGSAALSKWERVDAASLKRTGVPAAETAKRGVDSAAEFATGTAMSMAAMARAAFVAAPWTGNQIGFHAKCKPKGSF